MSALRGVSRYREVLGALRLAIAEGDFADGRLPAEPDLARRFGVSRMTLRRALAALVDEGVVVSRQGQGTFLCGPETSSSATGTIAFLLAPHIGEGEADPYFMAAVQRLTTLCQARHRGLLVVQDLDRLASAEGWPGIRRLDGIIASAFGRQAEDRLRGIRLPLVLLDSMPIPERWSILPDNAGAIAGLVHHLTDFGHRRIAHIAGPADILAGHERREAWRTALLAQGLPVADLEAPGGFASEDGYRAMQQLWTRPERPTAVVCVNDRAALGAMAYLQEQGVRIPHDISMVGIDDIEGSGVGFPRLTTMAVDRAEMASLALQRLLDPASPGVTPGLIRVPVRLVFRHSTAVPPVG